MVDGEQGEFQAIRNSGLVEDGTKIVLDDLFGIVEFQGNVLVLVALDDEAHNAEFFGSESLAGTLTDDIGFKLDGCLLGTRLHIGSSAADRAEALDEFGGTDVTKDNSADSSLFVRFSGVGVLEHSDDGVLSWPASLSEQWQVGLKRGGTENQGSKVLVRGLIETVEIVALTNDPEVFLDGEQARRAGSEDGLIIGDHDLETHR